MRAQTTWVRSNGTRPPVASVTLKVTGAETPTLPDRSVTRAVMVHCPGDNAIVGGSVARKLRNATVAVA